MPRMAVLSVDMRLGPMNDADLASTVAPELLSTNPESQMELSAFSRGPLVTTKVKMVRKFAGMPPRVVSITSEPAVPFQVAEGTRKVGVVKAIELELVVALPVRPVMVMRLRLGKSVSETSDTVMVFSPLANGKSWEICWVSIRGCTTNRMLAP